MQSNSLIYYVLPIYTSDPDIQPSLDEGMEITNETRDRANAVLNATDILEQRLAEEEANVVFIQENINNASVIITGLPDRGEPGQNIFEFV